jgi:hypothetical protein
MTDQEIIDAGTSANEAQNATRMEARAMEILVQPFLPVEGTFINTSTEQPEMAHMVPIDEVDIPIGTKLYLQMLVTGTTRSIFLGVAHWIDIFQVEGYQIAIMGALDVAVPDWRSDPELVKKVALLPGPPPPPSGIVDPTAPAAPNWMDPRGPGMYGNREGDFSPEGTQYELIGTWVKGHWLTQFELTWKMEVAPQPIT